MASGNIQPDGSYVLSSLGTNDGIPRGTYTITVTAFEDIGDTSGMDIEKGNVPVARSLIDMKYNSTETSGLSVDVQGSMVHNITVEPFTR